MLLRGMLEALFTLGAIEKDRVWDELLQLVAAICGKKLFDYESTS